MSLPAGWYTDQNDANVERYWDGNAWGTGPDAVRGQPHPSRSPADPGSGQAQASFPVLVADPVPKPSAPPLVSGLLCIILGPVFAALFGGGFAMSGEYAGSAVVAIVLGNLVGIAGLVLLIIGVYRLASGVDHLVGLSTKDR